MNGSGGGGSALCTSAQEVETQEKKIEDTALALQIERGEKLSQGAHEIKRQNEEERSRRGNGKPVVWEHSRRHSSQLMHHR